VYLRMPFIGIKSDRLYLTIDFAPDLVSSATNYLSKCTV
jgi:hypothetical protein